MTGTPGGLSMIVAMDDERGIGRLGGLPWHYPSDLRRFRSMTMGKTLIMGRRTLQSLPGPLDGRRLVVISRTPLHGLHGCLQGTDIEQALSLAGPGRHVVIGGEMVYRSALPLVDEIDLTRIPGTHGCDTFFPRFEDPSWTMVSTKGPAGLFHETWVRP